MCAHFFASRRIVSVVITDVIRDAILPPLGMLDRLTGRQEAALKRPRVQILNLHYVFDDETAAFRRFLQRLVQTGHRLIGYSEAVERLWRGALDAPYVTFSFDDGLKSTLRAAAILDEFGAKACFFVTPSMIGESDPQKVRNFCFQNHRMPPTEFLSWDDVAALQKSGHEIGSHTMTHAVLSQLPEGQLWDEIGKSREVIAARTGSARHFSWPLGTFADFSPQAAKTVFESGFESCASAVRGCHVAPSPPRALCLRRNHARMSWPVNHHLYYMSRQSRVAAAATNEWPESWKPYLAEKR